MEAVAANALVEELAGEGEAGGGLRDGGVEGGVEAGELGEGGPGLLAFADEFERDGNVERGEVDAALELVEERGGDGLVGEEVGAAVDDAMGDGNGRRGGKIFEPLRGELEGGALGGEGEVLGAEGFAGGVFEYEFGGGLADAVGEAVEEELLVVAVPGVEAELEGGGAGVDDEDEGGWGDDGPALVYGGR